MLKHQKIIAVVGLCGSGKTEVGHYIEKKYNYSFIRFGQTVLDIVKQRGLKPTEKNEQPIRHEIRQKYGQAAVAILNIPKIDQLFTTGKRVIIDGLYSWAEYKELKNKYRGNLVVIAVYASPNIRYSRLVNRGSRYKDDPNMKYRSFSTKEAGVRDYDEIENINKAGPIAMADYTIINESTIKNLSKQVDLIIKKIN